MKFLHISVPPVILNLRNLPQGWFLSFTDLDMVLEKLWPKNDLPGLIISVIMCTKYNSYLFPYLEHNVAGVSNRWSIFCAINIKYSHWKTLNWAMRSLMSNTVIYAICWSTVFWFNFEKSIPQKYHPHLTFPALDPMLIRDTDIKLHILINAIHGM